MPNWNRIRHLAIILPLTFLLLVPVMCEASSNPNMSIAIDAAYYDDLDGDGLEDDVHTDLTFLITDVKPGSRKLEFYFTLTLPSGIQYIISILVVGKVSELHIRIFWYDAAWQSGWYNLQADAFAFGGSHWTYTTASYDFDPPTGGGGGDPHAKVWIC